MLVFRSGAVKIRMGDILFDVFPGAPSECRQVCRMLFKPCKG